MNFQSDDQFIFFLQLNLRFRDACFHAAKVGGKEEWRKGGMEEVGKEKGTLIQ